MKAKLSKSLTKNSYIALIVFYIVCVISLYIRNMMGLDIGDEPYHESTLFQVLQGNRPLMSIWDGHTGFFLMAPFAAIYKYFVPSLEGAVLYFREVALTLSFIALFFEAWLVARKNKDNTAILFLLPACFIKPTLVIYYNSAASILLSIVCTLIYTASGNGKERIRYFITGIFAGLVCLNYPTFSLIIIALGFYIIWKNRKNFCLSKFIFYAMGVVLVALLFLWWIFSAGSIHELKAAVDGILNAPHTKFRGAINVRFLFRVFIVAGARYLLRKNIVVVVLYLISLFVISKRCEKSKKEAWYVIAYAAFVILSVLPNRSAFLGYYVFSLACGFLVLMFLIDKTFIQRYSVYYITVVMFVIIYSLTSDNANFLCAFSYLPQIIVFTIVLTLYERASTMRNTKIGDFNGKRLYMILLVVISVSSIANSYGAIYNDESINHYSTDTKMTSGIYKGIYTTAERKAYVENLESFVHENINSISDIENKKFGVITLEPEVYMMTPAKIYTPWTYDAQYLFKGFYEAGPLLDYYKFYGAYPDIIFADNLYNTDFFENDKYEINSLIKEKYEAVSKEKLNDDVTACVWVLKNE